MSRMLWSLFFVWLITGCVIALIYIPEYQARHLVDIKEHLLFENEARRTLAQIFGGLFLLVGLYFTYQQVVTGWQNVHISYEGQVTERFTRAIDQLGSEKAEIRIGGIYALERIAKDSVVKDHWYIMDILTAFIRMNSRKNGKEAWVAADIQAALTVLGRRNTFGEGETHEIDLSGTNLRSADLHGPNWQVANFSGAEMANADLRGALLVRANFKGAHLEKTHFEGVDLSQAENLTAEQLQQALTDSKTKSPGYIQHKQVEAGS